MQRKIMIVLTAAAAVLALGGMPAQATPVAPPAVPVATAAELGWITDPGGGGLTAQTDAPQPVTWGACGVITPEKKLIRMFKKKGGKKVPLYCGGPKYDDEPTWGLRHILKKHRAHWEAKTFGTNQGWRELADISIDAVLKDPDVAGQERRGKRCFSRHVFLWSYETDEVIGFMTVKVVFKAHGSHKIITAYPADNNCDL